MTDVRRIVSENRRAMAVLAAALAVNAALYALVVYPLSQRVAAEERLAGDATRDLTVARRAFEAARGTVAGKQRADEELTKFYGEVLPSDQSSARSTLYPHVGQLARKAKVTTLRFSIASDDTGRGGPLRKLTMNLSLAGEYTNVRHFIHELETAPEFLVLEGLTVSQGAEDRGLNVTANVATYYRAGDHGN